MIQPRNNMVVIQLVSDPLKQVGKIVVSTGSDLYCQADVLAVGPGLILAAGARPDTHDLRVGQRVLVQHQAIQERGNVALKRKVYTEYSNGDQKYQMIGENFIVAILAEPDPLLVNVAPFTFVSADEIN